MVYSIEHDLINNLEYTSNIKEENSKNDFILKTPKKEERYTHDRFTKVLLQKLSPKDKFNKLSDSFMSYGKDEFGMQLDRLYYVSIQYIQLNKAIHETKNHFDHLHKERIKKNKATVK